MVSHLGNGISFPVATAADIKASGIAFPVIGLILLILRGLLYTLRGLRFGLAEAFAIFAWLNILGMGVALVWSASKGSLGWPTPKGPQLTETHITNFEKNSALGEYVFLILLVGALGTTKLSFLFFIRKIIATGHRTIWSVLSWVLIGIVAVWTIAFALAYILICGRHPTAFWSPYDIEGKECLQITGGLNTLERASFISDLILDVLCILFPLPTIFGLHLAFRLKIAVAAVFMVGITTVIAGIARLVIWIQILNTAGDTNEDLNLAVTLALQWGMIEAGLAFIVSQLPALAGYLSKSTRRDIAGIIRDAAAVISLRSNNSGTSSYARSSRRSLEASGEAEQHELGRIRRVDVLEVENQSTKSSGVSDTKVGQPVVQPDW